MATSFDDPIMPRLPVLLRDVAAGAIQIPDVQRRFVWNDGQRLMLLDSVYQQIPIGSLLLWRTSLFPDMASTERVGAFTLPRPPDQKDRNFLLDGMQRLLTLYFAFTQPPQPPEKDGLRWPVFADLSDPAGVQFRSHPARASAESHDWFPLWKLFDDDAFDDFRMKLPQGGHHRKLLRTLEERFRDYRIPLILLRTENIETVQEAFVRINSQGTKVSEASMVRAFSVGRKAAQGGVDLDAKFAELKDALAGEPWRLFEDDDLLALIKVLLDEKIYKNDPKKLAESIRKNQNIFVELPSLILRVGKMLRGWGIGGPRSLPYIFLFAGLCWFFDGGIDERREADLKRWFFAIAYGEDFSGATSAQIFEQISEDALLKANQGDARRIQVRPLRYLRMNSVRGRLALCSMARSGEQAGEGELVRPLGEMGTDFVLALRSASSSLANRVLASSEELKRLRWLLTNQTTLDPAGDAQLLRKHLFLEAQETHLPVLPVKELFRRRQRILDAAERKFVEGLGFDWLTDEGEESDLETALSCRDLAGAASSGALWL